MRYAQLGFIDSLADPQIARTLGGKGSGSRVELGHPEREPGHGRSPGLRTGSRTIPSDSASSVGVQSGETEGDAQHTVRV